MILVIAIPADPAQPLRLQEIAPSDLDAYRSLVGGSLQLIELQRPPASLYLNEEGKLLGLPVNPRATALAWVQNSAFRDGADVIVGDVFLAGPVDKNGDDRSVPGQYITLLLTARRFRVEVQYAGDEQWHGNDLIFDNLVVACLTAVEFAQRWAPAAEVRVVAID